MQGTRSGVLNVLEAWSSQINTTKMYWLTGMAGIGKSTISQTLCERLDKKNILGASFFCSRASDKTNNAGLIIPSIAYTLSRDSSTIHSEIVKAILKDPDLVESNDLRLQFEKLVSNPIKAALKNSAWSQQVVVIDAVDECTDLSIVRKLIMLFLESLSNIPLKIFISSRDEYLIRNAFDSSPHFRTVFQLHDLEKDIVAADIRNYLLTSLWSIRRNNRDGGWPPDNEVDQLVVDSGSLFIYAATAIRYINDGRAHYKDRLSSLTNKKDKPKFEKTLDGLYVSIVRQACDRKGEEELDRLRKLVSMVVFLRYPLTVPGISFLSGLPNPRNDLSELVSVIHLPVDDSSLVAPFHASFPDFLGDSNRCCIRTFPALDASESHTNLALMCLQCLNSSLRYNICGVAQELTISRKEHTNSPDDISKIPEELTYACLYWVSHCAEVNTESFTRNTFLQWLLREFLTNHLLHWIECLSVLHELKMCVRSLQISKRLKIPGNDLLALIDDGLRMLLMSYKAIERHCFQVYESALVWIPKKCKLREVYARDIPKVPKILLGLSNSWDPSELVIQTSGTPPLVAVSPDEKHIISATHFGVELWNMMTGQEVLEWTHIKSTTAIAIEPDGIRIVTGSKDSDIEIWNVMNGVKEASLYGHDDKVTSIAISSDDFRIVSGSCDGTVRIWEAMRGKTLEGHSDVVTSVAFSPDGARVVSGSRDQTVRIWNAKTGALEGKVSCSDDTSGFMMDGIDSEYSESEDDSPLVGPIVSVAFSPDSSQVIFGSADSMVRIWHLTTDEVRLELKGHSQKVTSVAFSPDSTQVASASYDKTVRIWDATTGKIRAVLNGHHGAVTQITFSPDSTRVISGSKDCSIRVWNTMIGLVEAEPVVHIGEVDPVVFSRDGSFLLSKSLRNPLVKVWNLETGRVQSEMSTDVNLSRSLVFSPDATLVANGFFNGSVKVWSAITGKEVVELKGHVNRVRQVGFSPDNYRLVSVGEDRTVRVWNLLTDKVERIIEGRPICDENCLRSISFLPDGTRLVSRTSFSRVKTWNVVTGELQVELQADNVSLDEALTPNDLIWNTPSGEQFTLDPSLSSTFADCVGFHGPTTQDDDLDWICGQFSDCYIPPLYQNSWSFDFHRHRASFGLGSGRVLVVEMSKPCL